MSGRSLLPRAVTTSARRTSGSGAPVHETTMSAAASSAASAVSGTDVAAYSSARRSALAAVRLSTAMLAAPPRERCATAREAIAPAPITSARAPATGTVLRSRAAVTSEGAARSMSVSAWARLPTRRACWKRVLRAGPTVPCSWPIRSASRVWPRIWPSPTTIESSPDATWKRCETAPSS